MSALGLIKKLDKLEESARDVSRHIPGDDDLFAKSKGWILDYIRDIEQQVTQLREEL